MASAIKSPKGTITYSVGGKKPEDFCVLRGSGTKHSYAREVLLQNNFVYLQRLGIRRFYGWRKVRVDLAQVTRMLFQLKNAGFNIQPASTLRPEFYLPVGGDAKSLHKLTALRKSVGKMYTLTVNSTGEPLELCDWLGKHGYMRSIDPLELGEFRVNGDSLVVKSYGNPRRTLRIMWHLESK
jgi:hypothetical protein